MRILVITSLTWASKPIHIVDGNIIIYEINNISSPCIPNTAMYTIWKLIDLCDILVLLVSCNTFTNNNLFLTLLRVTCACWVNPRLTTSTSDTKILLL